jgi:hypothetical protein
VCFRLSKVKGPRTDFSFPGKKAYGSGILDTHAAALEVVIRNALLHVRFLPSDLEHWSEIGGEEACFEDAELEAKSSHDTTLRQASR